MPWGAQSGETWVNTKGLIFGLKGVVGAARAETVASQVTARLRTLKPKTARVYKVSDIYPHKSGGLLVLTLPACFELSAACPDFAVQSRAQDDLCDRWRCSGLR